MTVEDFIFTIGYQEDTAIVDGRALRLYGKLTTEELAQKGFFKSAFCSALYAEDENEAERVLAIYNKHTNSSYVSISDLKRLFGVYSVPDGISKVLRV